MKRERIHTIEQVADALNLGICQVNTLVAVGFIHTDPLNSQLVKDTELADFANEHAYTLRGQEPPK